MSETRHDSWLTKPLDRLQKQHEAAQALCRAECLPDECERCHENGRLHHAGCMNYGDELDDDNVIVLTDVMFDRWTTLCATCRDALFMEE